MDTPIPKSQIPDNPTLTKPSPCPYIVRFWMEGVGFGRQEAHAADAISAGVSVEQAVLRRYPDSTPIIIGIVRK